MAREAALLGLLAFLLGCSGASAELQNPGRLAARKCVLTGNWTNELNSTMQISGVSETGAFSGSYLTAVTASNTTIRPSPLQGIQHQGDHPTFGFTVSWRFTETTAVFVGQCFLDNDGEAQLKTTWLLRVKVKSVAEDWKATQVGMNTFQRTK